MSISFTDSEIEDLNDLSRVVLAASAAPPCGEWGRQTLTAWLTWWNLALANIQDEEDGSQSLPDELVGAHYDTLYRWADRQFRQGICYEPSAAEVTSFDEMWLWLREETHTLGGVSLGAIGIVVGVIGIGLTVWSLWSRKGKRR